MPKSMAPCDAVKLFSGGSGIRTISPNYRSVERIQGVPDRLTATREDDRIHRILMNSGEHRALVTGYARRCAVEE